MKEDKLNMAREELIEEHKLAYDIFDELFSKKDKTELEKKILHFSGMIMQTHGFLLDR